MSSIKKIFRLSFQLAISEFKLKNEGSYLGVFWYILNPLLMFGLLFFIFNSNFGGMIEKYPLYLLVGILIINIFQNTTSESILAIIDDNKYLIKSINFPKEALIISIIIKNIFSHAFELIILVLVLFYTGTSLLHLLTWVIIITLFMIFLIGCGLILSSITVFFIDLYNIWNFFIRILWFVTPIFYASDIDNLQILNYFNPLFYFIDSARNLMIENILPENGVIFGLLIIPAIFFGIGIFIFKKIEPGMAEKI